jgi:hypothetical protein
LLSAMTYNQKQIDRGFRAALNLLIVVIAITSFAFSATALASALSNARRSFIQGDLNAAAQTLEPQLFPKARIKGKELNDSLEMYGIVQFMLGNREKSERAFNQLLRNNPSAKLDKRYILDPGIEPFFNKLREQRTSAKASPPPSPSAAKGARKAPPRASPPTAPKSNAAAPKAQAAAFTGIEVSSNAPRTIVFADGIFVGSADQKISLDPKQHMITISAEGYESIEMKVNVQRGQGNKIVVSMKKALSAQEKAAKKASTRKARDGKQSAAQRSSASDDLSSKKPKRSVDFNIQLPQDKQAAKANRQRKSLADQFFQEQQAPAYSQPYAQPPAYQQPPPVYQQPPPVYQQPQYPYPQQAPYAVPQYQQPGYAVPYQPAPQYAPAPPPAYSYPAPDPYGAPAYPPAGDYGTPNPYEEEYEAGDGDAPRGSYGRPAAGSRRRAKRSGGSAGLALLPFGVGQFQNNQSGKGMFFLLAEGGALGYGLYVKLKQIPDAEKIFVGQRQAEIDSGANQEDIDAKEVERQTYIKKVSNIATYSFIGTGVLYAIGVVDAFMNLDSGNSRRRAESPLPTDDRKVHFGLEPHLDGGVSVRFSLKLE